MASPHFASGERAWVKRPSVDPRRLRKAIEKRDGRHQKLSNERGMEESHGTEE